MAIVINPISPVAFSVFGLDVRWYALAYVVGFVAGYFLFRYLMRKPDSRLRLTAKNLDDLLTMVVLGTIVGGRLGYVLFYNMPYFMRNPWEIFAVWHGGMSFHGGLIGVFVGVLLFSYSRRVNPWRILDLMAVVAPIGLFFGRIANFINMELLGRETERAWGIVIAGQDMKPVHPSPLYEAALEGIALFVLMFCLYRRTDLRCWPGALSGVLAMGYAGVRILCEQFRAPDAQIGFLTTWGLTMGQLLSGVLFFAGAAVFINAIHRKKVKSA